MSVDHKEAATDNLDEAVLPSKTHGDGDGVTDPDHHENDRKVENKALTGTPGGGEATNNSNAVLRSPVAKPQDSPSSPKPGVKDKEEEEEEEEEDSDDEGNLVPDAVAETDEEDDSPEKLRVCNLTALDQQPTEQTDTGVERTETGESSSGPPGRDRGADCFWGRPQQQPQKNGMSTN